MAVRRESVRLDVEGNFAQKMFEDAAAVEALKHSLKDLSGQSVQSSRATKDLERDIDKVGKTSQSSGKSLDSYTNRVSLLAAAIGSVAPALVPLGGVAVGGLAGIANDAGMAAIAAGSLVVAFHGVGSTLQTVNKAALDPTTANLAAAQMAMQKLTPAARQFVNELHGMGPIVKQLQASAASGWFPGLTKALHELTPLAPVVERIFHDVGAMGGKLAAEGAKALAGPEWASFFRFIDREAPKAMAAMGHVIGSVAHGLAELWMAFSPLNHSFNNWIVDVAKSFDSWATGLSKTQGFHDFLDYIHQTGPQVAAAVSAIAHAVIQIVQAAAPLGGPTLQVLTAIANVLGDIAASPLGTPILLLIQLASVVRLASAAVESLGGAFKGMGASAIVAGEEAKVAGAEAGAGAKGGLLKSGLAGPLIAATAFQIGANNSGTANSQNNFATAAGSQNLAQMQAALADMEKHYSDWQKLAGHGGGFFGGLGVIVKHPLDAINDSFSDVLGEGRNGLAGKITSAKDAIAALEKQQAGGVGSFIAFTKAMRSNGAAAQSDAALLREYKKATQETATSLSAAFDAETNWRSALKAAQKQAASNSAGINGNSDAVLANRAALAQLRDAWDNQTAAVRGNLVKQAQAQQTFIQTAEAMGVPTKQAEKLARQLLGIPKHINPIIQILAKDAPLKQVLSEMQSLHDKTVNVWTKMYTIHVPDKGLNTNSPNNSYSSLPGNSTGADGTTVPKTGRPYADRHLYMLADGEEVISNRFGQADRHRSLLKDINAGRLASGGSVGGSSASGKHHPNVLSATELSSALQSLISSMGSLFGGGAGATTPGGQALAAMNTFAATIKRDGGHVGANFGLLSKQIAANATQYDTLNTKLQALVATQQSLIDGVKQAFTTDVFTQSADLSSLTFGGGRSFTDLPQFLQDSFTKQAQTTQYANIPFQLATDSANASNYADELRRMRKNLGQGYADIAGSNDQGFVDWLSHQSAAVQRQYGHAFASRDNQVQRAATSVGAGMGPQIAAVRSELAGLRGDNKALLKRLEDAVHGTVSHKVQADQANLTGAAVGKAVNRLGPSAKTQAQIHAATKPGGRK